MLFHCYNIMYRVPLNHGQIAHINRLGKLYWTVCKCISIKLRFIFILFCSSKHYSGWPMMGFLFYSILQEKSCCVKYKLTKKQELCFSTSSLFFFINHRWQHILGKTVVHDIICIEKMVDKVRLFFYLPTAYKTLALVLIYIPVVFFQVDIDKWPELFCHSDACLS